MEGEFKENQLHFLKNFKQPKNKGRRRAMDPSPDNGKYSPHVTLFKIFLYILATNQATIRDLCPTDKARIRQLVEDLARLGAEKVSLK